MSAAALHQAAPTTAPVPARTPVPGPETARTPAPRRHPAGLRPATRPPGRAAVPGLVVRRLAEPARQPWSPRLLGPAAPDPGATLPLFGPGRAPSPASPAGPPGAPSPAPGDARPAVAATRSGEAHTAAGTACTDELARRLVQAVVDVLRGHRPASQLLRWTTPEVYSGLRQRARVEQAVPARPGSPVAARRREEVRRPVVRSVRTSAVGPDAVEVSAVVVDGPRARAVAARLDGAEGRWRLVALEVG